MTSPLNEHGTDYAWPWREVERLQQRIDESRAELDAAIYQLALLGMAVKRSHAHDKVKVITSHVRKAAGRLRGEK